MPRRRRARAALVAVALLAILLLALATAWFERRTIAQGYADDLLRQRGVAARYEIAELGLGRQRLTNVVLGDPARPDLSADWIETRTEFGFGAPRITGLRAGRVRLRGQLIGGRVSFGALDKLLPPPSGKPFALPDLDLAVADGRLRLDTPAGPVGLKLSGAGGLQGGFAGTIAATAPRLVVRDCMVGGATAYGSVRIANGGAPRFAGPVRVAQGRCGGVAVADGAVVLDLALGAALDRWRGTAALDLAGAAAPGLRTTAITGNVRFAGDARATSGEVDLNGGGSAVGGGGAAGWSAQGGWRIAGGRSAFTGTATASRARLPMAVRRQFAGWRGTAAGTPVGPLVDRLAAALTRESADLMATADLAAAVDPGGGWAVRVGSARVTTPAGGDHRLTGGRGLMLGSRGFALDGTLVTSGGGLPAGQITLAQAGPGTPLTGTAMFAPYRAGDAALALTPVRFTATPGGRTGFTTRATLSGPLGGGRIDDASLALTGGWDGRGRLVLNPACAPAGFRSLAVAGLVLDAASFRLCPAGPALVTLANGRLGGGAGLAAARFSGRLGASPVTIAAAGSELRFTDSGLGVRGLALRLGDAARPTRLDIASLTGRIAGGGVAGRYAGAGGQLGAVPLLLSDASGDWRLAGGTLTLDGALTVSDAAAQRRFEPLPARDVTLRLADGVVTATGRLTVPGGDVTVADVAIRHRLSDATGHADLTVPGLTFGPTLQPTALTPITLGIVADVKGTIAGRGRIDWNPAGVTSSGRFGTDRLDLAAAFGPVAGLRGDLVFTDLLALQSAPGQVATVASINPGVAVEGGTVRYQLLPGPRIRIEGAQWPFAGGALTLEPALLDFSQEVERRLTFRVAGMDAALFLQRFDYKNLAATGVFDGVLPIVFDQGGGRIAAGRLTARGGGTLAYVGEVSQEDLGPWGNLAFQALKALRYRELEVTLNGPLAGEMVTEARFGGIAQGEGAKSNFLIRRLAKLPFVFNVRITAPFRALLDTARSFYDPNLLVQRNLPSLIEAEKRRAPPVQPPASGPVPQEKPD